ncbi:MAG: hypothetical protein WC780_13295 [Lentimicrobiaceae bacterium]|jgi:hypothetical protein
MIIVIEPQCYANEHSDVNAALLAVIRSACPLQKIVFFAENSHLNLVKEITTLKNINLIDYYSIKIPNRNFIDAQRIFVEWVLTKQVFHKAKALKAQRIIFSSVTSSGLWCIKLLIRKFKNIDVIVIPHTILESVTEKPSLKKPWNLLFWFRYSLIIGNVPQLRFMLFGESKGKALCQILPQIQNYVISINLPYFFKEITVVRNKQSSILRFGYFGDLYNKKSTNGFSKLALEVHQESEKDKSKFILIGYIGDPIMRGKINSEIILPSIDRPLEREQYDKYANMIDYAVYFFKPKSYALTVSASFYDALAYIKPIIAIKTPFFEYYFNIMGDIGYLCEDYNDMKTLIIDLIINKPTIKYAEQCNNIIKGRKILEVENLSLKMKNIFNDSMKD